MTAALVIEDLNVSVDGHRLVSDVSLSTTESLTGLVGPNGAGKSTLMRAIVGLLPVESGSVKFEGQDLLTMPRRQRAQMMAFVEQSASTEERLTVWEVVGLGRIPFQTTWQTMLSSRDEQVVGEAIVAVGLADLAHRLYSTLSAGEQQRAQIARALAQEPRLLVLDEPTSHLDINAQLLVLDILRERARLGVTVLLALHDLNLAASSCASIVLLAKGSVVMHGAPDEVLAPALLREVYGVDTTRLIHPETGRAIIAFDARITD